MATEGWLGAVESYLKEAAGGPGQKRDAYAAARDIAKVLGVFGQVLGHSFWAWLTSGGWLKADHPEELRLEDRSRLSEDAIRDNYPGVRYPEAERLAVLATGSRVSRCALHLEAGWPTSDCLGFVYTREEWREAMNKSGRTG